MSGRGATLGFDLPILRGGPVPGNDICLESAMSDHHDAQDYTANGPTAVGFKTGGMERGLSMASSPRALSMVFAAEVSGQNPTPRLRASSVSPPWDTASRACRRVSMESGGKSTLVAGVSGSGPVGVEGDGTTGVFGRGETGVRGNGNVGFGVDGYSKTNAGVHGSSVRDRGGVFESNEVAQVRLIPRVQETQEPQLSRMGRSAICS